MRNREQVVRDLRAIIEDLVTEAEASAFFDRIMPIQGGNSLLLSVFCDCDRPVRWWAVFYRDWC